EELISHHRYAHTGFAIAPQGAPTNNTETEDAAFARGQSAAEADAAQQQPALQSGSWWSRSDGAWLADALGVSHAALDGIPGASRTDFSEARAMNRLLWPTTLGYALDTMLAPAVSHAQAEATRWFFTHFVSGRGFLPCVRVGNQPYGVLPISALSQWNWLAED